VEVRRRCAGRGGKARRPRGELSGEKAYMTRRLRIKASLGDMLKLQALNRK
jgi:hypothetical protein